jgi:hypothetical protein
VRCRRCGRPGQRSPWLGKMNTVSEELDSLRSTDFTFLSQMKVSSVNISDFKFIISIKGGHCEYWPRGAKKPSYATAGVCWMRWYGSTTS